MLSIIILNGMKALLSALQMRELILDYGGWMMDPCWQPMRTDGVMLWLERALIMVPPGVSPLLLLVPLILRILIRGKEAKWGSLTDLGGNTIAALSSTNFNSDKIGVWMIKGKIVKK